MRENGDIIRRTLPYLQLPTDTPTRTRFFLVNEWHVFEEKHLINSRLLCTLHTRRSSSKSSTKKGLLNAPEESCKEHFKSFILDTPLWHDAMSANLKEPAAKDFVERKARTIELSEAQGTHWNVIKCKERLGNSPEVIIGKATINLDSWVWKSLEDSLPKLYCIELVEAYVTGESAGLKILCEMKRYELRLPNGRLHQKPSEKGGKGKEYWYWVYYQVPASNLLWEIFAFCARNLGVHVQGNTLECQVMRKQDKKSDSCAAEKGAKKLGSSNCVKNSRIRK